MNDELPCLDLLEATPGILRGLMAEISEEDARWKPAADRFSIAEVLAHLSPYARATATACAWTASSPRSFPSSNPTTRRCTWSRTATAIPKMPSTISRSSARPTSSCCADLPAETGDRKARA